MSRRRCFLWGTARFPIWNRSGTSSFTSSVTIAGRRIKVPSKPKRPCSYPGCPKLTHGRFCEEHEKKESQRYEKYDRDPAVKKRYGRAWKRIRDRYIAQHPLCEQCLKQNKVTPAEEVHNILPLSRGGTHCEDNLMSLCTPCHSKITALDGDRWTPKKRDYPEG